MESDRSSDVIIEGTVNYFSHEREQYVKASDSSIYVDRAVSGRPSLWCKIATTGGSYTIDPLTLYHAVFYCMRICNEEFIKLKD